MKALFAQFAADFLHRNRATGTDPLLTTARVLLWVVLAGIVLALVMSVIGLASYVAARQGALLVPVWEPVWRPVSRLLFGIGALWIGQTIATQLLAMIGAVEQGDAFSATNVKRLEGIAWSVIELQVLGFIAGMVGTRVGGSLSGTDVGLELSPGGVAFALLLFILARIFRTGAQMREDLEGTV